MPVISVIMSVYNCEKYIKESVESILNQTFSDFEFIIADDCSTDNTLKVLKQYEKKDNRIKLMKNSENLGLTKTLNNMLDIANGEFVARMDGDDISYPQRFEKQISSMKNDPGIGVCGTNTETFGNYVEKNNNHCTFEHEEIKAALLFGNCIPHASLLIRKKIIDQYKIKYNENYRVIQDYELWSRLICSTKFYIIPDILLKYRVTNHNVTGISLNKEGYREKFLNQIYGNLLEKMGISFSEDELFIHSFIASNTVNKNIDYLKDGEKWLKKLYKYNQSNKVYDERIFEDLLYSYWFNLCTRSTSLGLSTAMIFFKSSLYNYKQYTPKRSLNILVKSLIKYEKRWNSKPWIEIKVTE